MNKKNDGCKFNVCYFQDGKIKKEYPLSWETSLLRKWYLEKYIQGYVWITPVEVKGKFKKGDIVISKNHNYNVKVVEVKNDLIFSGEVMYSEYELYKSGQIVENFCVDFFEEFLF